MHRVDFYAARTPSRPTRAVARRAARGRSPAEWLVLISLLCWALVVLHLQVLAWRRAAPYRWQLWQYTLAQQLLVHCFPGLLARTLPLEEASLPADGAFGQARHEGRQILAAEAMLRAYLGWEKPEPDDWVQALVGPPRTPPFELGIFTTVWRRPQLTALTLAAWQQMQVQT